jgi:hypothetical protein
MITSYGFASLPVNTTGDNSTAIGKMRYFNTTGSDNAAIGYNTLFFLPQ